MKLINAAAATALVAGAYASSAHAEYHPYDGELSPDSYFEQFDGEWEARWKESHARKDDEFAYVGKWNVEEATVYPGFSNDKGLVLKSPAAHHAISSKLPQTFDNTDNTLVLQYEVKLQKGLSCGGAYVKLLSAADDATEFSNETPYQVMFGPDKCGTTNKVHFIIKRKDPHTGVIEEKHLSMPPMGRVVKTTSLYTLIIKPNQDFEIRINGDVAKAGNLLDPRVLNPPLNPAKEIEDPEDTKPADWVDDEYIPDPEQAGKPEDWDEDAPFKIADPEAVKPADWNEEAAEFILDPEAEKPEDWDDEEDGEWLAPEIPNPECATHGCGEWIAPLISNPAYKGKWDQPTIPNPEYKGPWSPRKITNPAYYEDSTPSNLEPIGGIGFELWTMDNDILFDNIYLGHSIEEAEIIGNSTWAAKVVLEQEDEAENAPKPEFDAVKPPVFDEEESLFDRYYELASNYATDQYLQANEFVQSFIATPAETLSNRPFDSAFYAAVFVTVFTIVLGLWSTFLYTITGQTAGSAPVQAVPASKKTEAKIEEITDDSSASGAKTSESEAIKRS